MLSQSVREVRLESAAVCQLKCPSCSTASGENQAVLGRGVLKAHVFEEFLDRNPNVEKVELSNYGEIFLNPEIEDIFRIAYYRGIAVSASNGVNLNTVKPQVLEALVKYEVRHLTVSLDGASQETYAQYRKNGNFDRVIGHLRLINEWKAKYRRRFPKLTWQFVVFGHNEHELPKARALATELGMKFFPKRSWDEEFSPIRDPELVRRETGWRALNRTEVVEQQNRTATARICNQLWDLPQINWDGKLLGCCVNTWGDFGGNVFSLGVDQAVTGEKIAHARKMLTGDASERADIPCATCHTYLTMKRTGYYLDRSKGMPMRLLKRLRSALGLSKILYFP